MFKTLYSKLAAVLAGLFCLLGLLFIWVAMFASEMYQQEVNQSLNKQLAKQIVKQKLLVLDKRVDKHAFEEVFNMLMAVNPSIEIYLLDGDGNILSFSAPPEKIKRKRVNLEPIRNLLEGDTVVPVLGDDPRNPEAKKVFAAARIPEQGKLEGYLYVILGGEIYDSVVQRFKGSYIFKTSVLLIFASLLFALAAGLILFALLTRRFKRLSNAMEAFKAGEKLESINLITVREANTGDEIDRLSKTFQIMAESINDQLEKLKESDKLRRDLIANVSHDLRTPLSTLQGYIETLLMKGNSLSNENRRDYLETTIKHCERMNKLLNELLELAQLESYVVEVVPEPFNINELVQDVVQKFRLKAKEKNIDISSNIEEKLPLVIADIGLIERVLENLVENAIQNTPQSGSICLLLAHQEKDTTIQISDSGSGIPEDELPFIFDRFYSMTKTQKGTFRHYGLGLAIAQKILELHNRSIEVTSAMNSGTIFSFQLPVFTSD